MTFKEGKYYVPGILIQAGISAASLRKAVADGTLDRIKSTDPPGVSLYAGAQILHALEQGRLTLSPSRAAEPTKHPTATVYRPATPKTITRKPAAQPSLQARYKTARAAWAKAVDDQLASCDGSRAFAAIAANREHSDLRIRVEKLHGQLQVEKQLATSTRPASPARDRHFAWVRSGKRGVCKLA